MTYGDLSRHGHTHSRRSSMKSWTTGSGTFSSLSRRGLLRAGAAVAGGAVAGTALGAARRDPKVFIGFSDLTALHGKLWRGARLVSFYGPLATWTDARTGPTSIESMRSALMTTDPIVITRDLTEPSSAVNIKGNSTG